MGRVVCTEGALAAGVLVFLAASQVLYERQFEARATHLVKGTLVVYCLLALALLTMRESERSLRVAAFVSSLPVGAALLATPVGCFLLSIYVMFVNTSEMHRGEDVTIASSLRWCSRELAGPLAMLLMTRRIVDLQAIAAEEALKAKELRRTSEAATSLVKARTDAVLQLDESLRVVEPQWQLAAMLGADVATLQGASFEAFLPLEEDRKRLRSMCKLVEREDSQEDAQVVDMIKVSLRNNGKSVTFGARLFHVPIHVLGKRGHLIGICRSSLRGELHAAPEPAEEPPPAPAKTLELPRLLQAQVQPAPTRSRSSRSSGGARASAHGGVDGGGGSVRALVNAMSDRLEILSATDSFVDFCDPTETTDLEVYLGDAGPAFTTWLQDNVQKAIHQTWNPSEFTRQTFGNVILTSQKDGASYSVRVTASIPDPFIADQLDGYPVSVSLERRELKFQPLPPPASLGTLPRSNGVFPRHWEREARGLAALPEGDSECGN